MPCYSSVTKTQMKDAGQLAGALVALGYGGVRQSDLVVEGYDAQGANLRFTRGALDQGFSTYEARLEVVRGVQRKYSEGAVRELARRRGFSVVADASGRKLTLINRRG
jgi:hypothetical protein